MTERGTGTPRTRLRPRRLFSANPPATAAAAVPTAIAGPLVLPAARLSAPGLASPPLRALSAWPAAELGSAWAESPAFEARADPLDLARDAALGFARDDPPDFARDAALGFARDGPPDFARDAALGFACDDPPDFARDAPLGFAREDPPDFAFVVAPDPFDELDFACLVRLPALLPADFVVAMRATFLWEPSLWN